MRKLILLSLFFPTIIHAEAFFHCYPMPGMPAQGYQFMSNNFGALERTRGKEFRACVDRCKKENAKAYDAEEKSELLCVYKAVCMPVDKKLKDAKPKAIDDLTKTEKLAMRESMLTCKGTETLTEGETARECPPPDKCRTSVFYKFTWVLDPEHPQGYQSPSPLAAPEAKQ